MTIELKAQSQQFPESVPPIASEDDAVSSQLPDGASAPPDGSPGESLDRREFLVRAATLALSAGALAVLLDACAPAQPAAPGTTSAAPVPQSTVTAPPTTVPAPSATVPVPSATVPVPSATVPVPSVTPPLPTQPPTSVAPAPAPVPGAGLDTERRRMGHLLRRAGFGANEQEWAQFLAMGIPAAVDYLVDFEKTDDSALESRLSGIKLDLDNLVDLQRWWLLRMVYTKRPLQEKMTFFWHGLLTSGYSKVGRGPYMRAQNETMRKLCLGRYGDLLKSIARDPAMLIWLDSQVNLKAAPNENFARELMELFSMGVGNYSEGDVRQSARAFTGWLLSRKVFSFNPNQHDWGVKTFLGRTGNLDGDDVIDTILAQPVTAEFITRKVFSFFVYDDPSPEVISKFAGKLRETDYDIKELMRQILKSPEFYSPKAYRAKVKAPVELIAGTVRALKIETDAVGLPGFAERMGQILFNPFDVSGWPGGEEWINSNTLLQRLNFANTISIARSGAFRFNPVETTQRLNLATADDVIAHFNGLLLDGNMSGEERDILSAFGNVRDVAGGFTNGTSPVVDERLRSLVYLTLASPDYQLA